VELERNQESMKARGWNVAAISYDSVAVLANFASRRKITFPLLSDPDSKVIREWGLLNESVPKGPFYGIPYPGTFMIERGGKITGRYFEENYAERSTTKDVLIRQFGPGSEAAFGNPHTVHETKHLRVSASASDTLIRAGQRIALVLDVELKPNMHVYAPEVKGYIPVAWALDSTAGRSVDAAWPQSKVLLLPALNEKVPVYENRFRVTRDFTFANEKSLKPLINEKGEFQVKGTFRYQACDDKVCYVPQDVQVIWTFVLEAHDVERVPADLRRK
jgi:hypothetical protein